MQKYYFKILLVIFLSLKIPFANAQFVTIPDTNYCENFY
jgi:hypothetical protein